MCGLFRFKQAKEIMGKRRNRRPQRNLAETAEDLSKDSSSTTNAVEIESEDNYSSDEAVSATVTSSNTDISDTEAARLHLLVSVGVFGF